MKSYTGILCTLVLVLLALKGYAIEVPKESKIQPLEPPIKTIKKLQTKQESIKDTPNKTKQTPNTTQDILRDAQYYQKILEYLAYGIMADDDEYIKIASKMGNTKVQEQYRKYFTKHFRVVCQYFVSRFQKPTPPLTWGIKPNFSDYLRKTVPVLYKQLPISFVKEKEMYDLFRSLTKLQFAEINLVLGVFFRRKQENPFNETNQAIFQALKKLNPQITEDLFINTAPLVLFYSFSYDPPYPPTPPMNKALREAVGEFCSTERLQEVFFPLALERAQNDEATMKEAKENLKEAHRLLLED